MGSFGENLSLGWLYGWTGLLADCRGASIGVAGL